MIYATKAKAIISKCNFLFREYPKQSNSFYKCNFYSRLLEYMTHILSAKIPHFNLKFQCLCMQRKRRKKEILWDGHFFWASRNSFQGIHLKMQMNRLSKVQKMKENLYLWRFFLPNCFLSSLKHKFCKSCYNNKWWIMCIIETCWLIGRQQLTESNTRVNNFAAATNISSHL